MNIINKKFRYLLDNVFTKINNVNGKQISQLNPDKSIFNINVDRKQYKKTNMELQFCNFNKLKYSNSLVPNNITKILKKPVSTTSIIDTNKSKLKDFESVSQETKVRNITHSKTTNCNTNNDIDTDTKFNYINCPCNYLKELTKIDSKLNILSINKTGDYLSTILLSALSPLFYNLPDNDKIDELKTIKLELITIFNKENYYRNYDYSTKHFKKIEADDTLSNNLPITVNMLKIFGDILSLNIVYIFDNKTEFITKFNKSRATVIISETKSKVYTITYSCSNKFLRGVDCGKILNINTKFSKCTLESKKLDELQNIAKMLNLDVKKQGKTGRVNIKKEELIEMIAV